MKTQNMIMAAVLATLSVSAQAGVDDEHLGLYAEDDGWTIEHGPGGQQVDLASLEVREKASVVIGSDLDDFQEVD